MTDRHDETLTPEQIVGLAAADPENAPIIRRYCLTSGGSDSSVVAHRCRELYDELVHIDTGTAPEDKHGTKLIVDHVKRLGAELDKPVRILDAGDAFDRLVLGGETFWQHYHAERDRRRPADYGARPLTPDEAVTPELTVEEWCNELDAMPRPEAIALGRNVKPLGFPGPAGHRYVYVRLKERLVDKLVADTIIEHGTPGKRANRVVLLSGVRLHESERRRMTTTAQGYYERRGNQVWENPLYAWTNEAMAAYRADNNVRVSDVAAILHRSGECNCGAFAKAGEREDLQAWFPEWWERRMAPLEAEARRRGIPAATWGERPPTRAQSAAAAGPLCSDCVLFDSDALAA